MDFLGAPYPIVRNPRGLLSTQGDVNQIKSDLLCLLLTNPGERIMLPEFGTPLRDLMFEPDDDIIINEARDMIINAITTWEPRINISAIDVFTESDVGDEHTLFIRIMFFDPNEIKNIQELKLQLPIAAS